MPEHPAKPLVACDYAVRRRFVRPLNQQVRDSLVITLGVVGEPGNLFTAFSTDESWILVRLKRPGDGCVMPQVRYGYLDPLAIPRPVLLCEHNNQLGDFPRDRGSPDLLPMLFK